MQQVNVYMYSSNSSYLKKLNEVCCCICKNAENSETFAKDFIQYKDYGSMITSLFLHSPQKKIGEC